MNNYFWDMCVAIGTGVIALFSVLQYRLSRIGAKKQLRSYLNVIFKYVDDPENQNKRNKTGMEFTVYIKNTGQTPAYTVTCQSKVELLDWPLPKNFKFVYEQEEDDFCDFGNTLGAGEEKCAFPTADRYFTKAEMKEFKGVSPSKRIYVHGILNYFDIFKKSHYTNFCFFVCGRMERLNLGCMLQLTMMRISNENNQHF